LGRGRDFAASALDGEMKMGPNSFVRLSFLLRRAFLKISCDGRWANPEMTAGELVEGELANCG